MLREECVNVWTVYVRIKMGFVGGLLWTR